MRFTLILRSHIQQTALMSENKFIQLKSGTSCISVIWNLDSCFQMYKDEITQGAILVEVLLFTCFKPTLQINEASLDLN